MDDRLEATGGEIPAEGSTGDSPSKHTNSPKPIGPVARRIRMAAAIAGAGALVMAVLPLLDGDGLMERTAVGRVVEVATAGGYALADEILPSPAVTVSASPSASEAPSPTQEPTVNPTTPNEPEDEDFTLFGSSLDFSVGGGFSNWVRHVDDRFSAMPVVRVFNTAFPRSWSVAESVSDRTVVVSFKAKPEHVLAGHLDRKLREWFASAPNAGEIYWTYFHEPEDNIARGQFTDQQFRDAWKHIHGIAESVGKQNLHATLVLMSWTTNPSSRRDWRDYYPGDEFVDVLGWDSYNFGWRQGRYADPEEMYDRVIEISEEVGKPWGIAETGSLLVRGDDGRGRAEWLHRIGAYLNDRGALWVTYFESNVGLDYRLHDADSREAWKELVRASARSAVG